MEREDPDLAVKNAAWYEADTAPRCLCLRCKCGKCHTRPFAVYGICFICG